MEEKEFKEKYYTSKTFKFELSTFEEFLKTETELTFAYWFCEDIYIIMVVENNEKGIMKTYNQFEVDIYCEGDSKLRRFDYFNNYGIDTREETYYEALDYAKKLFLNDKN